MSGVEIWSHNDEDRRRPLVDALEHGCAWIEPDVWVVGDEVMVGHDRPDARMSLRSAYLSPLLERADAGALDPVYLVLDVKSEADSSLPVIERVLRDYPTLINHWDESGRSGPVTVVLSGNLANRLVSQSDPTWVTYDGRVGRVPAGATAERMPLVSAGWRDHFRWRGVGSVPQRDQQHLRELVDEVHAMGLQVRFWGLPEWTPWRRTSIWRVVLAAGVDVVSTDHPAAFASFLRQHEPASNHQDVSRGRPSS